MRLNLTLQLVTGNTLPCNYMYELSSCLYRVLNEGNTEFATWLHDTGFCKEKKAFKLFTFSHLHIPRFQIEEDRIHLLADYVQLTVSFFPIKAIESFVLGIFRNRRLEIGDKKSHVVFEVTAVEQETEPTFTSCMTFKTISPLFIEEQFPDSNRTIHLSPSDPKFIELLHLNLLDKYRAFYNLEPNPSWSMSHLAILSPPKSKTITLKAGTPQEIRMKGYLFSWIRTIEQPRIWMCENHRKNTEIK